MNDKFVAKIGLRFVNLVMRVAGLRSEGCW